MIHHGDYRSSDGRRLALSDLRSLAYAAVTEAGAHGDEVLAAVAEAVRTACARGLETDRVGRHRCRAAT